MMTMVSMSLRSARVRSSGVTAPPGAVAKFVGIQLPRPAAMPAPQRIARDARKDEKVVMGGSIRWSAHEDRPTAVRSKLPQRAHHECVRISELRTDAFVFAAHDQSKRE